MTLKFFRNAFVVLAILSVCSCKEKPVEDDLLAYGASGESFTENPLMDAGATRLWCTPDVPNADQPLTISFRAGKDSPLKDYTGEVYAHIGIIEYGTWKYVKADWTENLPECRFTPDKTLKNVWHLELGPTVREYFDSGETPLVQIGIVIRNVDGSLKGIEEDSFISVKDDVYKAFETTAPESRPVPAGCKYGINVIDSNTITFVLHDKDTKGEHRDFAYILGDFNSWKLSNDDKSRMYRDDASGCWWITVSGLDPAKEYRYQYHVGDKSENGDIVIRLADAFCEKVLDPDNDKWINYHHQIYPDSEMIYPGKEGASGHVSCVRTVKEPYAWSDFRISNPESLVIYEMLFGDFTSTADIKGAMQHLDYLKSLGVNAVELMPVQEFDGNESWGYNPCYYFALDKAYGTIKDYKDFIDACHRRGIAVILDVVYNHNTGASPLAKLYWNPKENKTAPNNPYFNVDAPHPWSVFHDFNHEEPFVRDLVKRSLKFMIEEYNVDGFRFDLSKGFTQQNIWDGYNQKRVDIIKEYNAAIKAVDPDCFVILEHLGDYGEEKAFVSDGMHPWRNMNGSYCPTAEGNRGNISGTYEYLDGYGATGWVAYMESHDEERMAYKQTKYGVGNLKTDISARMDQLALNAVCFLGVPGPKMIWQMGELGYDYNKWCDSQGNDYTSSKEHETSRKPVKWDYHEVPQRKALHDVYEKMMGLRNSNPELFGKSVRFDWTPTQWPLKWIGLETGTKKVHIYANFAGNGAFDQKLSIPEGSWRDYMTGTTVNPGEYILKSGKSLVIVSQDVK